MAVRTACKPAADIARSGRAITGTILHAVLSRAPASAWSRASKLCFIRVPERIREPNGQVDPDLPWNA